MKTRNQLERENGKTFSEAIAPFFAMALLGVIIYILNVYGA